MSGKKISLLTEVTDVTDGDYTEIAEDGGGGTYLTKKYDVGKWAKNLLLETAERTADHELVLADANQIVFMNKTGAATLTVPTNASVPFTIGTVVGGYNASADAVTVVGAATVTVRNAGAFAQYSEWSLRKRGTNEWVLVGATI